MRLKDIVNRDIVTLTNCESEPIHIPGAIQPHGFLLALKGPSFTIDFCSANAVDFCGATYEQLLGKSFAACFGADEAQNLLDYLQGEQFAAGNPTRLVLGETPYSCTIRLQPDVSYLLEAEPYPDGQKSLQDLYQQTRKFVSLMERSPTLRQLCQAVAEETRAITGYDRVMIYRFDKHYNGEVIAEAKRDDLEPFLHLHYPHTDIPAQARELYLRNLLRMIVDVNYVPVPIYTIDDSPGKNLDLSHSVLRSVSPIHIEYLKNMGVGATLTISLIHEKRLWGLIACHHYSAKNIPHYTRLSARLQGHFLTSQIAVRESSEAFEASKELEEMLERLLPMTTGVEEATLASFTAQIELLQIARANGVAIVFNGVLHTQGEVPAERTIRGLGDWLKDQRIDHYVSDHLAGEYSGDAAQNASAAGILYHALHAEGRDYIIWFRREQRDEVIWAGDPSKAIVKNEKGLSPRKSFAQWREQISMQSVPWTDAEQTAASNLAHTLQRQLLLVTLASEERRFREMSEKLMQANEELERINWISTHDLQEPLRKIQVFASRVIGSEMLKRTDPVVIHTIERMDAAASRMQTLIRDINTYSKLLHQEAVLESASLESVLAEVLKSMEEEIADTGASITSTPLPEVKGEPFLLRQVFVNLLRNALKFVPEGTKPVISITAQRAYPEGDPHVPAREDGYYRVSIADNGIGFDSKYSETIFGLFKRLHTQTHFAGTGIGLALCRKIMSHHSGYISAEAKPGEGATFHLWFPA
jgi:light-regulated signal transduction histidine kinase (bacteriophytochrome)